MDLSAAAPSGFMGWILEYGQVVAFIAQIVYWLGMLIFIGYAVATYKRYTNWMMGLGRTGKLKNDAEKTTVVPTAKTSVEEFVE